MESCRTFLEQEEVSHESLSKLIIVDSMPVRKAQMAELVGGFIGFPGGLGIFEKFLKNGE